MTKRIFFKVEVENLSLNVRLTVRNFIEKAYDMLTLTSNLAKQIFVFILSLLLLSAIVEAKSHSTKSSQFCNVPIATKKPFRINFQIVQKGLQQRGLYDGPIDNVFGRGACTALDAFMQCEAKKPNLFSKNDYNKLKKKGSQKSRKCYARISAVTNKKTKTVPKKTKATSPLKNKTCDMSKAMIASVQADLKDLGFYKGSVDGLTGPATRKAFLAGENAIFNMTDAHQECISREEADWLSILASVKMTGSECEGFNTVNQMKKIAPALSELGLLNSKIKKFEKVSNQQSIVKAIIKYERQLSDDLFETNKGFTRDCRLVPVEMKSLFEAAKPKPITLYSLVEAQYFMEDLKIYLDNCENYFGSQLTDKTIPVLSLQAANSWNKSDQKNFESLKDFALNAKSDDGYSMQCELPGYGTETILDFQNFHTTRKLNRDKSYEFALTTLQSEIKSLIKDGNGFRQDNPFDPSSANVKTLVAKLEQGIEKRDIFHLAELIDNTRQGFQALDVPFIRNEITLANVEGLSNKAQLALANKLAELNESLKTRAIENEVASKETELAALEELDDKKSRFIANAQFLFEDIREYYASGETLGLDLAVYINNAKGAEKSQNWSDELVQSYEALLTYVSQYDGFISFRTKQAEMRSRLQAKLTSELTRDIDRIIAEIERWAAANPFAESSSVLATLIKEFGQEERDAGPDALEAQLNSLLQAVAEQAVELPISELLARRGYSLDGENDPLDTSNDVIIVLRDAQQYILDIQSFNEENPNAFGFELIRLYNSIRPIIDDDLWDDSAKSAFRSLQDFVAKNEQFVQFRYASVVQREKQLAIAITRLRNDLQCLKKYGEDFIKRTLFEKDTSNVYEKLDYASRFEKSDLVNDYLQVILQLRETYSDEQISHSCNEPLELELLLLSEEERRLVLSINRMGGLASQERANAEEKDPTTENKISDGEQEINETAEQEAERKAAELEIELKKRRLQNYEENEESVREGSNDLVEDIKAYLKDGNVFDVEFASNFAAISRFLNNDIWTIEQFYEYVDFERFSFSFESFSEYQASRELQLVTDLNIELDQLINDKIGLERELVNWVSSNSIDPDAAAVLSSLDKLQQCNEPLQFISRLEARALTFFKSCIAEPVEQIKATRNRSIKFCGDFISLGQCKIKENEPVEPKILELTLKGSKSFLKDLQQYAGVENDSCVRSPKLVALAAPTRLIMQDVWSSRIQEDFKKLQTFALSCQKFAKWHLTKQQERNIEMAEAKREVCSEIENIGVEMDKWVLKNPFDASTADVLGYLENISVLDCQNSALEELTSRRLTLASFWNVVKPSDGVKKVEKKIIDQNIGQGPSGNWSEVKDYISVKEKRFCNIVDGAKVDLESALQDGNQLKQNRILRQMDVDIEALLPDGRFDDWVARVEAVYSTQNGDAGFLLSIQCDVEIGSGKLVSETGVERWYAAAEQDTAMYNQLLGVSRGDFVIVSGSFLSYQDAGLTSSGQKFLTLMGNSNLIAPVNVGEKDQKAPDYLANIDYLSKL